MIFWLAERLHCFVADIEDRMTADEFLGWMRYYGPKKMPRSVKGVMAELGKLGIEAR